MPTPLYSGGWAFHHLWGPLFCRLDQGWSARCSLLTARCSCTLSLFRVEECTNGGAFDIHDETSRSVNMKDEISENGWQGERGESSDDQLLSILTGGAYLPEKVIGSSESPAAESMRYRCRGALCSNSAESPDLEERVNDRWKEELLRELQPGNGQKARVESLKKIPGVGPVLALRLVAAFELGRRSSLKRWNLGDPFLSSRQVFEHLEWSLAGDRREHFSVLLLDVRHRLLATRTVSIGSLTASIVHPREVYRPAILASAAAIIVAHNHPSGDPSPSGEDVKVTRRLHRCGQWLGIPLLDHVICGQGEWHSLRDLQSGPWERQTEG